jgi:hypothetical protein
MGARARRGTVVVPRESGLTERRRVPVAGGARGSC